MLYSNQTGKRIDEEKPFRVTGRDDKPLEVVVVDFSMGFWSMALFMVQWVLASIPAMIILYMIYLVFAMFFV